jgi:ABC-type Mn2+/Zn2+ transport system ATPase subunit
MTATNLLQLDRFKIGYGDRPLTEPISCAIPIGARVGVIGANGSGKSTFIKTILGLTNPLAGSCVWRDHASFGYVPQESQLNVIFPLTVNDLLKMGMHGSLPRLSATSSEFERKADEALALMEIPGLQNRLVRELSGGQRQRALIARALIQHPNVLILDEPFNSLDYLFKQKLWTILSGLRQKEGLSLILIEHDLNRVVNQIDWVVLLGPGRTLYGPIDAVLTEANLGSAFNTPVRIFKEPHEQIQVHFL